MRTFDFAPLHSVTVGFDQIAYRMDRVLTNDAPQNSYPPDNIEKTDDDSYRISIAVAGFSKPDLNVELRENSLVVTAKKMDENEGKKYLHRGIATPAFERRFHLADQDRVTGASHADGMLHIDLTRELPEALKPRRIQITSQNAIEADVVDAKAKAKAVN